MIFEPHNDVHIAICPCSNHRIQVTLGEYGYYYSPRWNTMNACVDSAWECNLHNCDAYEETRAFTIPEFNEKLKAEYNKYKSSQALEKF